MGHAATALSQMIGQPVNITVPAARMIEVQDVPKLAGGEDVEVAAVYLQVMGQARGHIMLLFPLHAAHFLIDLIAPGMELRLPDDEMARSAMQEIGNILGGSFLRSLAELTQLAMLPSVPAVAVDFAGSILGYAASNFDLDGDALVTVRTDFDLGDAQIEGHCIFVPDAGALQVIFASLGMGG
jgi:chemotaxis protein CheC